MLRLSTPCVRPILALFLTVTSAAAAFGQPHRVDIEPAASPETVAGQTRPLASLVPAALGDSLGFSISTAGDINGDGYSDYLVGAPGANGGKGRVDVYLGSASGTYTFLRSLTSTDLFPHFGAVVASAGDINGDGYDDILVGQPEHGTLAIGRVWIYLGGPSGVGASANQTLDGIASGDRFGASISSAGNVNGDGYDDIVVGSPGSGSGAGRAVVYLGGSSGLSGVFYALPGPINPGSGFGASVSGGGDVNGDGFDDVPGARVSFEQEGPHAGVADSLGQVEFSNLWAGPREIDVRAEGYEDLVTSFVLHGGTSEAIYLRMRPYVSRFCKVKTLYR